MYSDKLKKEVFKKIRRYDEINRRICEIEEEFPDVSQEELLDENSEYGPLCLDLLDLESDIEELMLDTKYSPLVGLTINQSKQLFFFEKIQSLNNEKNLEKILDIKLLELKDGMKERLRKVRPLKLTSPIDSQIPYLYKKIIRCYIDGSFEASCVLCRAISEFLIKEHIKKKGYGHLLKGKEEDTTKMSLPRIIKQHKLLTRKTIGVYYKIMERANNILHEKDVKTEDIHALTSIELLQSFIEEFPKIE